MDLVFAKLGRLAEIRLTSGWCDWPKKTRRSQPSAEPQWRELSVGILPPEILPLEILISQREEVGRLSQRQSCERLSSTAQAIQHIEFLSKFTAI